MAYRIPIENGKVLCAVGDLENETFSLPQKSDRSTNVQLTTSAPIAQNTCYKLAAVGQHKLKLEHEPFLIKIFEALKKEKIKILNLYCGIGGNRELWGDEYEITAVEINPKVAAEYQRRYPNDIVIVADAHEYLLHNYKRFNIIWTSPPCPTHSRTNYFTQAIRKVPTYPDMKLWQEIIFLNQFFKGLWMVENVIPFYEPFLPQYTKIGRHFIWSNFKIPVIEMPKNEIGTMMKQYVGTGKHAHDKSLEDRNAVNSELGLHILNCAVGKILIKKDYEQHSLFENEMQQLAYNIEVIAVKNGYSRIAFQENIGMLSYSDGETRINIYLTKMTVATCLKHPKKGATQLFRRNVNEKMLNEIFEYPRKHTGKGYYTKQNK